MIKIINISKSDVPSTGTNTYSLMINERLICTFDHERHPNGLSECLRDAADAHDEHKRKLNKKLHDRLTRITLDDCEPKMDLF